MTSYPGTYCFSCESSLESMLPILNDKGPWLWSFRDSDSERFYLITHAPPRRTKIKITGESPNYCVDITRYPNDPAAAPSEEVHGTMLKSLLPGVGATAVRAEDQ